MTAPVFVVPSLADASAGAEIRLDGPEGRHAVTVRRLTSGEALCLVDGLGRRVVGTVAQVVDKQALDVRVDAVVDEPEPQPHITVVQALPKGERGELAVEVLTEVGVDTIVPWAAATSVAVWKGERAARSHQRWADAAHAAAKQARRARFPDVTPLARTADVVERVRSASLALVLHEEGTSGIGTVTLPNDGEVVVIVGPEGGLTDDERQAFTAAGAIEVRLGPSVLRTSSAGIAAVAALLAGSPRWAVPGDPRVRGWSS